MTTGFECFRVFFDGIWWWFDNWIHWSICNYCRWWGPSRLCHRPLYGLHWVSVSTLFWGQTTSPFPRYIFILLFFYSLFLKDSFISRSTYSQRTEAILDRCLFLIKVSSKDPGNLGAAPSQHLPSTRWCRSLLGKRPTALVGPTGLYLLTKT